MAEQDYLTGLLDSIDSEIAALEAEQDELSAADAVEQDEEPKRRGLFGPPDTIAERGKRYREPGASVGQTVTRQRWPSTNRRKPAEPRDKRQQLKHRMQFLNKLKEELDSAPELFRFVDSFVGKRVQEAERRQSSAAVMLTMISSVVSLVAC